MNADGKERLISYHDTWISLDPIKGCPRNCAYCVLRLSGNVATRPRVFASVADAVRGLLDCRSFVRGESYLAIGNETDMLARPNRKYLLELLASLAKENLSNPVVLITKADLDRDFLKELKCVDKLCLIMVLSYSGLGPAYEPGFTDDGFRRNFILTSECGLRVIHFWRPILEENSGEQAIQRMLEFVSRRASASVFVGMKLYPELSRLMEEKAPIRFPPDVRRAHGEWLAPETVGRIYRIAAEVCPDYPLYRHTSCAMAKILGHSNRTGTVFRPDICGPSRCPRGQREICARAKRIASPAEVADALRRLGSDWEFECRPDRIRIKAIVLQEEYSFLLHRLNCPIETEGVHFENVYRGSIFDHQKAVMDRP
jgi:DNA repair photolyase